MKLTLALIGLFIMQASASVTGQKVSIKVKNASLYEVITQIRQQTKITILYNSQTIAQFEPITLSVKNEDLYKVLDRCFQNQPAKYEILNNEIIITPKKRIPDRSSLLAEPPVQLSVSGKITDESGTPLPGVTVRVKNSGISTIADQTGNFSVQIPEESAILIIDFVGYETKEVAVKGRQTLHISLKEKVKSLDQIVIIGYGTQSQKDLTGSVTAVTAEQFNKGVDLSPQQLLQGKAGGLNISMNSGKPGGSSTVLIRGATSVTGTNNPLYVIDGVPIDYNANSGSTNIAGSSTNIFDQEPVNPLQTLNQSDIESITVLKDASATAIYGSRAANGVIVITTKSGKPGKVQTTYNGSFGTSKVAGKLDMLTADQYRKEVTDLGLPLTDLGANMDWQDQIYRTALSNAHTLALSGGNENTVYRASVGYGKENGIVKSSDLEHINFYSNLTHKSLNNKLKFNLNVNYGYNFAHLAPISNTVGGAIGTSMNYEAYVFNPTYPIYDDNGDYTNSLPYRINPLSFATEISDQKSNRRLIGSFKTTYNIIKSLSAELSLGYTRQETSRNTYIDKDNPLGNGYNGYVSVQTLADYNKLIEGLLRYNNSWGKSHIDAILGYSYQYFYNENSRTVANGFLSDAFKWYSLQAAQTISSVASGAGSNQLLSTYARVNYNYDERFLLTATIRRDGSDRFGKNNQYGTFPSASLAWRLSQEKWFNSKNISDLKLRLSYGLAGNQDIGNLASISTLSASSSGYMIGGDRITLVVPTQYANPDLQWESTGQLDAGIDVTLLNSRMHATIDYYNKRTTNLLLSIAVPSPSAISKQTANVGSVQNKGIELEIGGTPILNKSFKWDISVNFSKNQNKVLSLSNAQYKSPNIQVAHVQGTVSGSYAQLILPGEPLGTFYGPKFLGFDEDGYELYSDKDQILGNAQPKFTYGFNNNLNYKNWFAAVSFRGVYGNKIYNNTANQLSYKIDMPGQNALATVMTDGVPLDQTKNYSSRWIESGSFLRLDNATIGYNFKLKTKAIDHLGFFITGQNLFVITPYKGLDPEVNANVTASGNAPFGIDYLGYPRARSLSFGVNLSFQ